MSTPVSGAAETSYPPARESDGGPSLRQCLADLREGQVDGNLPDALDLLLERVERLERVAAQSHDGGRP